MSEVAGTIAAVSAALFFGSYAVPLKFPSVLAAKVDPIVYQTYKSFACFSTSWLVLLIVPLKFTWWGMLGATLWCSTGIVAIMAVRWAGIGVAQSLWSGISIFVSYIWGAYIFAEPIENPALSIMALGVMAMGMTGIGMAASGKFSSKVPSSKREDEDFVDLLPKDSEGKTIPSRSVRDEKGHLKYNKDSKFVPGVICAAVVGVSNGSFLIPLKYATQEVKGVEYLVSFGVGTIIITAFLLMCHSILQVMLGRPRPAMQFKVAAGPGLLTGLLWSAGNVSSIYAMQYLGLALGWPLVQCQLLVSAMWAVFYYEEVSGRKAASILLASCGLVVVGAIMLSRFGTVSHPSHGH
ncbi:unnamed protein product [Calypogeia fissa]